MKFTGERFIPTEQGEIRIEHYHRYAAIVDLVANKNVLDIACGEGYGSSFLADTALSVVGVDISNEAVKHAKSTYKKSNLSFQQGTATSLDFTDATFDIIVSFETIEHLAEQGEMLAEIKRVLRPDGILVISSPNRPVYSEERGENNEFHVKELDFNEFDALLKTKFPSVKYFGQRLLIGSVIQPIEGRQDNYLAWHDDGEKLSPNSSLMVDPVYYVAVCGGDDIVLPKIDTSVLYPDNLDLVKHYVGFAKWAQTLDKLVNERDSQISKFTEIEEQIVSLNQIKSDQDEFISSLNLAISERDGMIASLNQAMSDREEQIINLTEETVRRGEWALRLESELKESQISLLSIRQSNSWKITLPLREARRWIDSPIYQAKRYTKAALSSTKKVYQALPLSPNTKAKHRHVLTKYFPRILRASGVHHVNVPVLVKPTPMLTEVKVEDIHLITCKNPVVSIIIPIYGKLAYTLRCLRSISLNLPKVGFEVIVVDDCSPDNSAEVIKTIPGVRLLQNTENLGFIRSCNAGASVSAGEYLLFLNNDTEVQPNWMDELLRTFHEFPGTGLAGSKLVYPDGRLQEAGGIIWLDGSAWNFGRLQDPNLPIYNYAREVDYCSGASIMVPKTLFDELNGFDEHYLPAYCEDADLALKIRDKGYRVIYQPQSTVIHYEGITSGTDTTQGIKSYQVENSKKLFERWQNRLAYHQAPGTDVDNAKDRKATKRVLVIEHCTPTPNQDAGSVTVFNLMILLREMDFQVTFIPEDNFLYMPDYTTALQRAGIEALYSPYVTSVEQHLKEYGERYDLAFLFRPGVADLHLKNVRKCCPKAKILFHTVDLHFLRMSREATLQSDKVKKKAADEMQMRELSAIRAADASIVHSTAELEILQPLLPDASLHVFPLIMDIKGTKKTFSERRDIVFIGGYQHTPNVDAVKYFVDEIMPLLRKQLPGVRFYAVGSNPPAEIQSLASEDVIITGFVDDLTPLLDKMRVSVAPLRYGAGIKGKIGTAMAVGLPVVGTSLAVEGMSLTDGENILVADSAEALANAVTKIYQDEELWRRISDNGLIFADKSWGAEAAWHTLSNILTDLGVQVNRTTYDLSLYSDPPTNTLIENSVLSSNGLVT